MHAMHQRTIFSMLDNDGLDAVFAFVEKNSQFAAALVCRAFNARHPTGTPFHTDVLAMNHTPTILAWAASLAVPCPPLQCAVDIDDASKVLDALRSFGKLEPTVLAQHAAAISQKLDDADVDVRYAALNVLSKLGPEALTSNAHTISRKLHDADADVRYAAVKALDKLVPSVRALHFNEIFHMCNDPDEGVQLAAMTVLRKMGVAHGFLCEDQCDRAK